jgi:D-alanyl-D-alanine carboxypeptidase
VPALLVAVDSAYVIQRSKGMELRPEANAALDDLAKAFYEAFGKNLYLVSAYRSYALQQSLISAWCGSNRCAKAGTSEHQLWLAIDIHVWNNGRQTNSMSNKDSVYYKRLEQNAHKFGWHNTFQKWVHIDGQMEEWRHRRYIGKSFATQLWEQDITLAEYYAMIKK